MSTFSDLLAALRLAPKTLPQAKETIDGAQATLDSVAALFTAAGLNLEQLLAAGPDSLKTHLESIEAEKESEAVAAALQKVEELESEVASADEKLTAAAAQLGAANELCATLGLPKIGELTKPEAIKTSFADHVSKQTTLALAKTGHPPAHVPAPDATLTAAKTDADLAKEYEALPRGKAKADFYAKHEQALWRFEKSKAHAAE